MDYCMLCVALALHQLCRGEDKPETRRMLDDSASVLCVWAVGYGQRNREEEIAH